MSSTRQSPTLPWLIHKAERDHAALEVAVRHGRITVYLESYRELCH
jgi:hypothetical protein